MLNLLYKIYTDNYDVTPKRGKKQQELYEKLYAEWDKVQQMFGDEFVNHIFNIQGELEDWQSFYYYRQGFRLGAQLMMEVFTSATE